NISGGTTQLVLGNVENSLMMLRTSGDNEQIARALETIKDAIVQSQELDDDGKQSALEAVQEISEEASKPQPSKSRLTRYVAGLSAIIKVVQDGKPLVQDAMNFLSTQVIPSLPT